VNLKVRSVPTLIGKIGHQKWKIIAEQMSALPTNYGTIFKKNLSTKE
tara:strand:- start:704 stop:844 length:141 start_codon:yes stop_codon:yes gene_type:complete